MKVVCAAKEVLATVRTNRDNHAKIVSEARVGFLVKAKEMLDAESAKLAAGKLRSLKVNLAAPVDHTSEYDTVIRMLEMHREATIELDADSIRMFVEDKWDWTERFLAENSAYSGTARSLFGN